MSNKKSSITDLVRWERPVMARFRNDMSDLFENLFNDLTDEKWMQMDIFDDIQSKSTFPKINVSETEDNYKVDIAVAGFSKDDVNLELKDSVLRITADKKEESESTDTSYLRKEISYRSFARAVKFPCRINSDSVSATYENGIISVAIDKIKEEDLNCGVKIEVN